MEEKKTTVVLGKLNINTNLFCSTIAEGVERVVRVISSHSHVNDIKSGKFVWGFREVSTIMHENREVICGKLFKMRSKQLEVVTETGVNMETIHNFAEAVAHFVFDPKTELIVFEDKHPIITPTTFCRMFAQLASHTDDVIRNSVTAYPKPQRGAFLSFLRSGGIVRVVKFELSPANGTIDFSELEREMRETRATSIKREYKSTSGDGLKVEGTPLEDLASYIDNGWAAGKAIVEEEDGTLRRKASDDLLFRVSFGYNASDLFDIYIRMAGLIANNTGRELDEGVGSDDEPS